MGRYDRNVSLVNRGRVVSVALPPPYEYLLARLRARLGGRPMDSADPDGRARAPSQQIAALAHEHGLSLVRHRDSVGPIADDAGRALAGAACSSACSASSAGRSSSPESASSSRFSGTP